MQAWVHATGRTSLELVTAARQLAERVDVFGVAEEVLPAVHALGRYGVSRVLAVQDVGERLPGAPVAAAVAHRLADAAGVVLFGTSYDGRDVAGRLSARLDRPIVANGIAVSLDGTGRLLVESSVFGGALTVCTALTGPAPWLASLRPKAYPPEAAAQPTNPEIELLEAPPLADVRAPEVVARHVEEREGPALDEAEVVVAGGRGLGSAEGFAQVEELARLLGGAAGATRAVVDAGWAPYSCQVGQTGKTVTPAVYLAFGISGAVQHVIGMKGAKHVVAVNKDPTAPVFALADLGVVGDARQLLPRLIQAVRDRQGWSDPAASADR
ncbi:MAG: electron transfer flavoprotein subunit alpha/FixB family protein [Actinomycetota bacterium]|nr:electron transfer flavoprotein subunit alpha/FixB family protein [Actinomycetota bacterium]